MYLQHQLLDGTRLHLPGAVSHLIYYTPASATASTDGQICPVCPVFLFIILHYISVTSKLDFWNSRKDKKPLTSFLNQTPRRGTVKIIGLLMKKFHCHPSYLDFMGKRWERWNTNPYKYLIFHSCGNLELSILCLTVMKYFSLTQANQTISVRALCEAFQTSLQASKQITLSVRWVKKCFKYPFPGGASRIG